MNMWPNNYYYNSSLYPSFPPLAEGDLAKIRTIVQQELEKALSVEVKGKSFDIDEMTIGGVRYTGTLYEILEDEEDEV